jgi:hypothetical protein
MASGLQTWRYTAQEPLGRFVDKVMCWFNGNWKWAVGLKRNVATSYR